jgi:RNA polymerase I-specific transcription initiation factor RRN7
MGPLSSFRRLIVLVPDVTRLAGEYYPIVSSLPSAKEERRARLARQKTHPLPQLSAQDPVEPALADGTTATVHCSGESHKIYYAHDILGSVSEEYALVVERAARWCGVGDEVIYTVVERFERRFLRWKKKKDKLEKDLAESEPELADGEEGDE